MTDRDYERLLILLAADDAQQDSALDDNEVNEAVAEAASLMADLRTTRADLASAAVWQQVATDARGTGHHAISGELVPDPWSAASEESEAKEERRFN